MLQASDPYFVGILRSLTSAVWLTRYHHTFVACSYMTNKFWFWCSIKHNRLDISLVPGLVFKSRERNKIYPLSSSGMEECGQSEHSVCGKNFSTGVFTEKDSLEVLLNLPLDAAAVPSQTEALCPRSCTSLEKVSSSRKTSCLILLPLWLLPHSASRHLAV